MALSFSYANIVAANSTIFFSLSEPSFPTVFVAWLNLDIGIIDVCFNDGIDVYTKTCLQLPFSTQYYHSSNHSQQVLPSICWINWK